MCGRFALFSHMKALAERFGVKRVEFDPGPRYNISPDEEISVTVSEDRSRKIVGMKWGLIPFWAKEPKTEYSTINARAETLAARPTFRHAFEKRRCLIPVDGFFEWSGRSGLKTPHFIRRPDRQPFAFAGLYDVWRSKEDDKTVLSATIVTTTPNAVLWPIHDRMPVILDRDEEETWLSTDTEDVDQLRSLMDPAPDEELEAIVVSTYVNKPSNKGSQCIAPVTTLDEWLR